MSNTISTMLYLYTHFSAFPGHICEARAIRLVFLFDVNGDEY